MKVKLNIIEPWDLGTEAAIECIAHLKNENLVIEILDERYIAEKGIQLFGGQLNKEDYNSFIKNPKGKPFRLNLFFDPNLDRDDLMEVEISEIRSNFVQGELVFV